MASMLSFGSSSASKSRTKVTAAATVTIDALPVHHVEADQERRARSLKHLLKANHVNYAVVCKDLALNNMNAHNLGTAYILGANENDLNTIYNEQIRDLDPWKPSPAEVIDEDWTDFLGDGNYQRAFVDFFEDKLAMDFSYDWKLEMVHVLTSGHEPLINGLIGDFGHAMNHLALAYEVDSKELAMEGLSLACIQYNSLHKYFNEAAFTKPSTLSTSSLRELIPKLTNDERLKGNQAQEGQGGIESVLSQHEDVILDYWNAWQIVDATSQFQESQEAAVALFASCSANSFSMLVSRLLSTSHAIRVLLPHLPAKFHVSLLRQWWLLAIVILVLEGRPQPDPANIIKDAGGRGWKHVVDKAINGPYLTDCHYVKAVRAMKAAAATWGDADELYLRSALTFVATFQQWAS